MDGAIKESRKRVIDMSDCPHPQGSIEYRREYGKRYRASDKFKAWKEEYISSGGYAAAHKRYRKTDKFKAWREERINSGKAKQVQENYRKTDKGRDTVKKWNSSKKGIESNKRYKSSEKGQRAIKRSQSKQFREWAEGGGAPRSKPTSKECVSCGATAIKTETLFGERTWNGKWLIRTDDKGAIKKSVFVCDDCR